MLTCLFLLTSISFARPRVAYWTVTASTASNNTNKSVTGTAFIKEVCLTNPNSNYVTVECADSPTNSSKGNLIGRYIVPGFSTKKYPIQSYSAADFVIYISTTLVDVVIGDVGVIDIQDPATKREVTGTVLYEQ